MARAGTLLVMVIGLLSCAAAGGAAATSSRPPGRIVYSASLGGGRGGLFLALTDASGATQITNGPDDFSPRWSPDGRRVVFVRSVATGVTAIWIVNAEGTGARPLDED